VKVALLPAKPLRLAKTRLGSLLPDDERMAVAAAMFTDVLRALTGSVAIDAVLVVTADPTLAAHARRNGAVVLDEGTPRGLNGAVTFGTDAAHRMGASSALVVLSDLPLLTASDVDDLMARAPARGVRVVPCKEGTGTNAILRRPPTVLPPCFGGRSLERHVGVAERHHLTCEIVRIARIEFDLDTPEDLRAFASAPSATSTHDEIVRLGLAAARPSI
jgi:2-phospho-L-lactate/phosphoenolpyruvate guanylyltransferase